MRFVSNYLIFTDRMAMINNCFFINSTQSKPTQEKRSEGIDIHGIRTPSIDNTKTGSSKISSGAAAQLPQRYVFNLEILSYSFQ